MAQVISDRMTAQIEGDFVVFLIGMRINKPWKLHKWLPVFLAMPPMLKELDAHPESGCLGYVNSLGVIVQYWRSFDHLEAYARSRDHKHWPAWVGFNKRIGNSRGDVGIWHETYQVRAGEYETVYSGMPPYGLGVAGKLVPASGRHESARGRIHRGNDA
jgi:fumigallin biosynthesis monooxygenase-like protein